MTDGQQSLCFASGVDPEGNPWCSFTRGHDERCQTAHPSGDTLADAWHEGWLAGCNDQQYGDENARPWTANPYQRQEQHAWSDGTRCLMEDCRNWDGHACPCSLLDIEPEPHRGGRP